MHKDHQVSFCAWMYSRLLNLRSPKSPLRRIGAAQRLSSSKEGNPTALERLYFQEWCQADQLVECMGHPSWLQWLSVPNELWILSYFAALQQLGWSLASQLRLQITQEIMAICDTGRQGSFVLPQAPMHALYQRGFTGVPVYIQGPSSRCLLCWSGF